jgi:hypothetical protein
MPNTLVPAADTILPDKDENQRAEQNAVMRRYAEAAEAYLIDLGLRLTAANEGRPGPGATEEEETASYNLHWNLREEINAIPALSIAGLKVKATAMEIALQCDPTADCEGLGSFRDLSLSIGHDILAMERANG